MNCTEYCGCDEINCDNRKDIRKDISGGEADVEEGDEIEDTLF